VRILNIGFSEKVEGVANVVYVFNTFEK